MSHAGRWAQGTHGSVAETICSELRPGESWHWCDGHPCAWVRCLRGCAGRWCPCGGQPTGLLGVLHLPGPGPRNRQRCSPPLSSPVKGRTNLKINEKYLSPDAFGAATAKCAGNQSAPSSKVLSPSRSNSSLSLYSSASAPSSPLARKVRAAEPPQQSRPPQPGRRGC